MGLRCEGCQRGGRRPNGRRDDAASANNINGNANDDNDNDNDDGDAYDMRTRTTTTTSAYNREGQSAHLRGWGQGGITTPLLPSIP